MRVRRALALTIDRKAICDKITKKGEQPLWSLCPTGLPGYPLPDMPHAPIEPDWSNYDEAFAADCARAESPRHRPTAPRRAGIPP